MKILIADDDPQLVRALRITLTAKGYDVLIAADGAQAIASAVDHRPDLILLDLGMPRLDGVEVIQAVRGWSQTPILVVSGRAGAADKVEALDAGADDYLTKPFAIDELLARVRALTRRIPQADAAPVVRLGDVVVDLAARTVTRGSAGAPGSTGTPGSAGTSGSAGDAVGEQIRLTPTEWQFLEILIRNAGMLVTRQTILTAIWGSEHVADTGYLRLYVSQLRKKLEADPAHPVHLLTEAGMGYRLAGMTR